MPIEDDVERVLLFMANYEGQDPEDRGHYEFEGEELAKDCGLPARRLNDVIDVLESRGLAEVLRALGTSPFNFHTAGLTFEGRLMAENLGSPSATPDGVVRVLFFGASPEGESSLLLDEEVREIQAKIRASDNPGRLEFVTSLAVRVDDVLQQLNEKRPHVVHFSAHASPDGKLALVGADGSAKEVSAKALKFLFSKMRDNVRVVVFNACHGAELAQAVVEHVDCAIGPTTAISNLNAQIFAASFYRALGFGRTVEDAVGQAQVAMALEGADEADMPQLHVRTGVDPKVIKLL
jgi:hypothetical protein